MRKLFFFIFLSTIGFAQGYICAVGGGSENYNSWSNGPYKWIVEKSDSNKIIILSVSDEDSWLINYFKSFGAKDVVNKKIASLTDANLQSNYDELISAKAVFIKGGDQYNYIRFWKDTKVENAIKFIYNNGGVIAGTSAGAMVLGEYTYSARYSSIDSRDILLNPFSINNDIITGFLDLVPNVIFDTHVSERGRFGRSIGFVLKSYFANSKNITGIAIDDQTALCINPDLSATVMGSGSVAFFYKGEKTRFEKTGNAYSAENLCSQRLTDGWKYDLVNNRIIFYPISAKSVDSSAVIVKIKCDLVFSGTNDAAINMNNPYKLFKTLIDTSTVLLISHSENISQAAQIINSLLSDNRKFDTLILGTGEGFLTNYSLNKIINNSAFIFSGDSLYRLARILDTTNLLGKGFETIFNSGRGKILALGNCGKIFGDSFIDNVDVNTSASYRGAMLNIPGKDIITDFIMQPLTFDNSNYYENRTNALLYGMMRNRLKFGLHLNTNDYVMVNKSGNYIESYGEMPLIIIDASKTTMIDSSKFIMSSGYKQRQSVAMNNLYYSVSNINRKYSLQSNSLIVKVDNIKKGNNSFALLKTYPNPFNGTSTITISVKTRSNYILRLYDIMGREDSELLNTSLEPGEHKIRLNSGNLSSGVYILRLFNNNIQTTNKIVVLK